MNDIDTVGGSIGCATSGVSTRGIAEGVGDGALGEAGDGDDVAGFGFLERRALDAAEGEDLGDAALSRSACRRAPSTFTAWFGLIEPEVMRPVMMRPR